MFLKKLFHKKNNHPPVDIDIFHPQIDKDTKDKVAKMLKANPEKLQQFEQAYKKAAIIEDATSNNLFSMSAKQASDENRTVAIPQSLNPNKLISIIKRATEELSAKTQIIAIENNEIRNEKLLQGKIEKPLTNQDLANLPKEFRPQLTGELMQIDVNGITYDAILSNYARAMSAKTDKERNMFYKLFRQGLDILDIDPITYEILGMNPNSMSHWLPKIAEANNKHGFFKIPKTTIAKVPMPILQLSRLDYGSLTPTTLQIVDEWAMKAFNLDVNKSYFIKTGTYSSKYDFRNAKVTGEKEVRELGEYLLFIQHQATLMASPLSKPSIYGASTTNEWVVREFIEDTENNPTIYKGLPLHTEYRIFVDFDTDEILGIAPYWEPDTMKNRFSNDTDANSPHQKHDYIIYKMHEETLMSRYHNNKAIVVDHIADLIPDVDLKGQWSIDIMQNGNDFYLIDMATADTSALNECVPLGKLKPYPINWIPELPEAIA